MGMAPAKGFESKARAELKSSLKLASPLITMRWGCSGEKTSQPGEISGSPIRIPWDAC
jgi:hypothetical protein